MEIRSVALLTWTRFMFYFCSTDAKRYLNFLFKDRFSMCVFVWVCVSDEGYAGTQQESLKHFPMKLSQQWKMAGCNLEKTLIVTPIVNWNGLATKWKMICYVGQAALIPESCDGLHYCAEEEQQNGSCKTYIFLQSYQVCSFHTSQIYIIYRKY